MPCLIRRPLRAVVASWGVGAFLLVRLAPSTEEAFGATHTSRSGCAPCWAVGPSSSCACSRAGRASWTPGADGATLPGLTGGARCTESSSWTRAGLLVLRASGTEVAGRASRPVLLGAASWAERSSWGVANDLVGICSCTPGSYRTYDSRLRGRSHVTEVSSSGRAGLGDELEAKAVVAGRTELSRVCCCSSLRAEGACRSLAVCLVRASSGAEAPSWAQDSLRAAASLGAVLSRGCSAFLPFPSLAVVPSRASPPQRAVGTSWAESARLRVAILREAGSAGAVVTLRALRPVEVVRHLSAVEAWESQARELVLRVSWAPEARWALPARSDLGALRAVESSLARAKFLIRVPSAAEVSLGAIGALAVRTSFRTEEPCICCAVLLVLRPSRAVESGRARYPESVSGAFWTVRARKCLAVSSLGCPSCAVLAHWALLGVGASFRTELARSSVARCQAVRPSEAGGARWTGHALEVARAWRTPVAGICLARLHILLPPRAVVTGNALDPFCAVASARAVSPSWRRAGFGALRASRAVEANFTLLSRKRFCSSRRIPASGAVETRRCRAGFHVGISSLTEMSDRTGHSLRQRAADRTVVPFLASARRLVVALSLAPEADWALHPGGCRRAWRTVGAGFCSADLGHFRPSFTVRSDGTESSLTRGSASRTEVSRADGTGRLVFRSSRTGEAWRALGAIGRY